MNASKTLNKIELRFWHIANPLLAHSRAVRYAIRFVFRMLEGDFYKVFLRNTLMITSMLYLLGILVGILS